MTMLLVAVGKHTGILFKTAGILFALDNTHRITITLCAVIKNFTMFCKNVLELSRKPNLGWELRLRL